MNDTNDPPPLDPATPASRPKPSAMSPIAGILGTIAGAFGGLMLYYGAGGIAWLVRDWRRVDREDVSAVVIFNVIGAVCVFVSARWIRSAIKGPDGRAEMKFLRQGVHRTPSPGH